MIYVERLMFAPFVERERKQREMADVDGELEYERQHYRMLKASLKYKHHTESARKRLEERAEETLERILRLA